MDLMKYFSWYLITINIVAFMMYGIDKEEEIFCRSTSDPCCRIWTARMAYGRS